MGVVRKRASVSFIHSISSSINAILSVTLYITVKINLRKFPLPSIDFHCNACEKASLASLPTIATHFPWSPSKNDRSIEGVIGFCRLKCSRERRLQALKWRERLCRVSVSTRCTRSTFEDELQTQNVNNAVGNIYNSAVCICGSSDSVDIYLRVCCTWSQATRRSSECRTEAEASSRRVNANFSYN